MISSKFQFEDDGSILFDRDVTIDDCLLVLRQKLAMFLKRIESYPRTSAGDYSRVSPRLGSLDGAGVLWEEVLAIAGVLQALTYREGDHILTRRDGSRPAPALRAMETRRTLKPLAELARELTFSILYEGGQFPSVIDRATVEKLECIAREIDALLHTGTSTPRTHHDASTSDQLSRHEEAAMRSDADGRRDDCLGRAVAGVETMAADADPRYIPYSEFPVELQARLRMAAGPNRKIKRVRVIKVDGVNLYSETDARIWWPSAFPTKGPIRVTERKYAQRHVDSRHDRR